MSIPFLDQQEQQHLQPSIHRNQASPSAVTPSPLQKKHPHHAVALQEQADRQRPHAFNEVLNTVQERASEEGSSRDDQPSRQDDDEDDGDDDGWSHTTATAPAHKTAAEAVTMARPRAQLVRRSSDISSEAVSISSMPSSSPSSSTPSLSASDSLEAGPRDEGRSSSAAPPPAPWPTYTASSSSTHSHSTPTPSATSIPSSTPTTARRISFIAPVRPGDRPAPKPFLPPPRLDIANAHSHTALISGRSKVSVRARVKSTGSIQAAGQGSAGGGGGGAGRRLSEVGRKLGFSSSSSATTASSGSGVGAVEDDNERNGAGSLGRSQDRMDGIAPSAPTSLPTSHQGEPSTSDAGLTPASALRALKPRRLRRPRTAPASGHATGTGSSRAESGEDDARAEASSPMQSFPALMSGAKQGWRRRSSQVEEVEVGRPESRQEGAIAAKDEQDESTRAPATPPKDQTTFASASSPGSELEEYLRDESEHASEDTHDIRGGGNGGASSSSSSCSSSRVHSWTGARRGSRTRDDEERRRDRRRDESGGAGSSSTIVGTAVDGSEEDQPTPLSYTYAKLDGSVPARGEGTVASTSLDPRRTFADETVASRRTSVVSTASTLASTSARPYSHAYTTHTSSSSSRRPSTAPSELSIVSPTPPLAFPPPPRPFYRGTLLLVRDDVSLDDESSGGEDRAGGSGHASPRAGDRHDGRARAGAEAGDQVGGRDEDGKAWAGAEERMEEVKPRARVSDDSMEREGGMARVEDGATEDGREQLSPSGGRPASRRRRRPATAPEGRRPFPTTASSHSAVHTGAAPEDDATLNDDGSTAGTFPPNTATPPAPPSWALAPVNEHHTETESHIDRIGHGPTHGDGDGDGYGYGTNTEPVLLWAGLAHPRLEKHLGTSSSEGGGGWLSWRDKRLGLALPSSLPRPRSLSRSRSRSRSRDHADEVGEEGAALEHERERQCERERERSSSRVSMSGLTGFVRRFFSARSSYDAGCGTLGAALGKGGVAHLAEEDDDADEDEYGGERGRRGRGRSRSPSQSRAGTLGHRLSTSLGPTSRRRSGGLGAPPAVPPVPSKFKDKAQPPLPPASGQDSTSSVSSETKQKKKDRHRSLSRDRGDRVASPTIIWIVSRDSTRTTTGASRRASLAGSMVVSPREGILSPGGGFMSYPTNTEFGARCGTPTSILSQPPTMPNTNSIPTSILSQPPTMPNTNSIPASGGGSHSRHRRPSSSASSSTSHSFPTGTNTNSHALPPHPDGVGWGGGSGAWREGRRDSLVRRETPWEDVDAFRRRQRERDHERERGRERAQPAKGTGTGTGTGTDTRTAERAQAQAQAKAKASPKTGKARRPHTVEGRIERRAGTGGGAITSPAQKLAPVPTRTPTDTATATDAPTDPDTATATPIAARREFFF